MKRIVLLRHGQSTWNLENRFTGWTDVPLTPLGRQEAYQAGLALKEKGFLFDRAFTSYLQRAIGTLQEVLQAMQLDWIPVEKSWRLNEKHYGALQGLNKQETLQKYGAQQVNLWRRGYNSPPPPLPAQDPRNAYFDVRYQNVPLAFLPKSESLQDTLQRILPYWQEVIFPRLMQENQLLIVAHGNSLRALIKHIKNISDEEIVSFNIPTAVAYVLEFDSSLYLAKDYFLANPDELKKRMDEVARQAEKKKE